MNQILFYIIFGILGVIAIALYVKGVILLLPADKGLQVKVSRFKSKATTGKTVSFGRKKMPLYLYNTVRYSILGIWAFLIFLLKILTGLPSFKYQFLLILILFIFSIPEENIGKIKLPYYYINEYFKKATAEKYNREIFWTISLLINLFTIKGNEILSSNYIFENIIKTVNYTKPIYIKMLSMWNMNLKEEATEYFAREIGTKEARDLSRIFLKLDSLSPKNFKNQLINYQNSIKSERATIRENINERNGNMIYIFAVISVIVVLFNFLLLILSDVFLTYKLPV
jgi:hypothetical protein